MILTINYIWWKYSICIRLYDICSNLSCCPNFSCLVCPNLYHCPNPSCSVSKIWPTGTNIQVPQVFQPITPLRKLLQDWLKHNFDSTKYSSIDYYYLNANPCLTSVKLYLLYSSNSQAYHAEDTVWCRTKLWTKMLCKWEY